MRLELSTEAAWNLVFDLRVASGTYSERAYKHDANNNPDAASGARMKAERTRELADLISDHLQGHK